MAFLETWHLFHLLMPRYLRDSNLCPEVHMCVAGKEVRASHCPVQTAVSQGQRPSWGCCWVVLLLLPQWHPQRLLPSAVLLLSLLPLTSHHLSFETPMFTFPGRCIFNPLGFTPRKNGFAPVVGTLGLLSKAGLAVGGNLCQASCPLPWNLKAESRLSGCSSCQSCCTQRVSQRLGRLFPSLSPAIFPPVFCSEMPVCQAFMDRCEYREAHASRRGGGSRVTGITSAAWAPLMRAPLRAGGR